MGSALRSAPESPLDRVASRRPIAPKNGTVPVQLSVQRSRSNRADCACKPMNFRPAVSLVAMSVCFMGGPFRILGELNRFVPVEVLGDGVCVRHFEPDSAQGLRLGGDPGAVRIHSPSTRLTVGCPQFSWDQYTVGLILPVIPVLMGVSSYDGRLTIQLRVEETLEPLPVEPAAVTVRVENSNVVHRPSHWAFAREALRARERGMPASDQGIQLSAHRELWFEYDIDCLSTPAFELTVPCETGPLHLRFEQQHTPFLFMSP